MSSVRYWLADCGQHHGINTVRLAKTLAEDGREEGSPLARPGNVKDFHLQHLSSTFVFEQQTNWSSKLQSHCDSIVATGPMRNAKISADVARRPNAANEVRKETGANNDHVSTKQTLIII
jgi:hypothetical protein